MPPDDPHPTTAPDDATRLRAALASITDAVFLCDVDGRFVDYNDGFVTFHRFDDRAEALARLFDYGAAVEVSSPAGEPLPPDRWPVARALAGEVASGVRYRLRRRDTDASWMGSFSFAPVRDDGGAIVGAVVTGRDISEQVRIEQELCDNRERLSAIVSSAMDGIVAVDAQHRVVEFNAAAEAIFGWPRAEVLGAPMESLIPPRFHATHADTVRRFAVSGATRRMVAPGLAWGLRRNGEEFPMEATISHLALSHGALSVVILRDVTERLRAESELRRARSELHELAAIGISAREQEKRRVARELHDDVAQSLAAMKIALDEAARVQADAQPALAATLRALSANADDVITSTRRIAADLRPSVLDDLGLAQALGWLAEGFTARTGGRCELVVDPPDLDLAEPYASAVFRIAQEAIANAARHAGPCAVRVTVRRDGDALSLCVRDDGRGFDPKAPHGAGSMGIAGLRERVCLLDGRVEVTSAPGRGTSVDVRLPLPESAHAGVGSGARGCRAQQTG